MLSPEQRLAIILKLAKADGAWILRGQYIEKKAFDKYDAMTDVELMSLVLGAKDDSEDTK